MAARVTIGEARHGSLGTNLCKFTRFSVDVFVTQPARATSKFFFPLGLKLESYNPRHSGLFQGVNSTNTQA